MDEEEEIKEVYAAFGLAAYGAQAFERQLSITLATAWGPGPSQITQAQYDALLEQYFHKTAGQLSHKAQASLGALEDVRAEIEAAVSLRNFLMHNYF